MFERFFRVLRASVAAIALIFKNFNAKIARFSIEKLRSFGAKRARHTRGMRAEAVHMHNTTCDTSLRLGRIVAGAGRVCCAKTAANVIETCAISSENREVFPQISVQKALLSSEKHKKPAQLRSMHQIIF